MKLRMAIAVLACVAVTIPCLAQPPRDTPAAEKATGVIAGTVFAADGRTPLPYAQVTLGGRGNGLIVAADARGSFEFKELPAGRFTATAWKNGYVRLAYGQRHVLVPSRVIELKTGERVEGIDFRLAKASAITVRVTNEAREPLTGIRVELEQYRPLNGERRLVNAFRSSGTGVGYRSAPPSDDRGEVRVDSLSAGEYYVKVMNQAYGPISPLSGRERMVYLDTYYPGTPSANDAAPIVLGEGVETSVSVPLLEGRAGKISGVVRSVAGLPLDRGRLSLDSRSVALQPDGTFEVDNVPAGDHELRVSPGPRDPQEYVRRTVHTSGDDLSVELITVKPWTMRGRLLFEGDGPPRDMTAGGVQVGVGTVPNGDFTVARVSWNPDWTFEIGNLVGPRILRIPGIYSGWSLKRVMIGDRDVSYAPIDPGDRLDVDGVRIVMTNAPRAVVSGGVVDGNGEPVNDYSVVMFPENPLFWGIDSQLIEDGRPDQQGRFEIRNIAPGHYFAVATPSLDPVEERDRSFLSKLKEQAVSITLDEGDIKPISLTLVERW